LSVTLTLRDELIMAYADGELDSPLADCIRQAVASDPAIRSRHAVYAGTRKALAHAFDEVLTEPLPARLTKTLRRPRLGNCR
jgi:anti-sigma factor RsiW